ncbi:hypothetical protein AYO20_11656 [Fonsecaea nubica]|uniref:Ran-specific GTPase-activating protein 30 n=1 Tax=Fonsecaea nubica TaxID=856822 RepID=A0A178BS07_9EURO|nr:hypothetical protein AYO20_11656 [Fonsecaea nubica]OAL19251.1 hypothetical protein AYO20_11656 [Fonsecaea nubica]
MDVFLGKVTQQAMNYAIRSGVTITASYAIRQSAKLLNSTPKSNVRDELYALQQRLQHKIRIVSPAIDMIELIAARGNTSLESAVALTKELRLEIQSLGQRLAKAADASEQAARKTGRLGSQARIPNEAELALIVKDIKKLLERIEDAVPLINLAITTSGASLSTSLPQSVSPSRLLQASTFLTAGDTQYSISPNNAVQIGPTFTLTVYMLFAGHDRPQNEEEIRETTWKEVIHKARVKLRRVPLDVVLGTGSGSDAIPSAQISSSSLVPNTETELRGSAPSLRADARADEYAYQMVIIEDFDDDRVHDFEDDQARPGPFDDIGLAGIREIIPVHEISKIFYADTSKVLNIGSDAESNHPVLLLKRDVNAFPPRRMIERDGPLGIEELDADGEQAQDLAAEVQEQQYVEEQIDDPWRFPPSLDPEWIAFEVYIESEPSDTESDIEGEAADNYGSKDDATDQLTSSMANAHLTPPAQPAPQSTAPPWANSIRTSLSLLELLLRLTSLQQFQQQSHLSITDELLTFFLEESASTGAGGDEKYRQALRTDARRRVGWDPYDESPVKRRGEEYQYQSRDYEGSTGLRSPQSVSASPAGDGPWVMSSPRSAGEHLNGPGRVTMMSNSPSPAPSPIQTPGKAGRAAWLRREGGENRKGSPLRPQTAHTDEGIGTSPASATNKD